MPKWRPRPAKPNKLPQMFRDGPSGPPSRCSRCKLFLSSGSAHFLALSWGRPLGCREIPADVLSRDRTGPISVGELAARTRRLTRP